MKTTRNIALAFVLATPLLALAQNDGTNRIDRREARQEARIQQGVQSGSLTERRRPAFERDRHMSTGWKTRRWPMAR